MIEAGSKAHRTAANLLKEGLLPDRGLNSKLHAVCDGQGLPLVSLLSEGAVVGFFAKLSRHHLKRGTFRSVVDVRDPVNRFLAEHSQ